MNVRSGPPGGGCRPTARGAGPAAILLVQGVEAQLHGALPDPPPGHTVEEVGQTVEALCVKALTP
ncbi:hypothetical protein ACI2L1_04260 [Streptomyces sp. NPDC019531]|uniref:hypothetical protein n=1 Tax=Streptomyces sp. NPDC019531 TaxID=3365062 RepID=UPI0038511F90